MAKPRWLQRWIDRERARPRRPIDHWLARRREEVKRLPRWLVGSVLSGSIALAVYWAATGTGLMRLLLRAFPGRPELAVLGTLAYTVAPAMLALWLLARMLRRRAPSNLPTAKLRE